MMLNVVGTCNVTLGTSSLFGKRILHGYGKKTKYWTQYAFHTIISFPQQYHDLITLAMISLALFIKHPWVEILCFTNCILKRTKPKSVNLDEPRKSIFNYLFYLAQHLIQPHGVLALIKKSRENCLISWNQCHVCNWFQYQYDIELKGFTVINFSMGSLSSTDSSQAVFEIWV